MNGFYRNPEYIERLPDWEFYRDLYEGKHSVMSSGTYLWTHDQELGTDPVSVAKRSGRAQRSRYLNLMEILVSMWQSIFFKDAYTPDEDATRLFAKFPLERDVDGRGTSLMSFIRDELFPNFLLYGRPIVLVDSFPVKAANLKQEREIGARAFFECLHPISVPDWERETSDPKRVGRFNNLRHEFLVMMPRARLTDAPSMRRYCNELFRHDGRYHVARSYIPLEMIDGAYVPQKDPRTHENVGWIEDGGPIATELQEIPVVMLEDESWVHDAANECLRYHNVRSSRDNILHFGGYAKVFLTGLDRGLTPDDLKKMSESNAACLPGEHADVKTVQPVDTTEHRHALEESMNNFFKVGLNMLRMLPTDSRLVQGSDTIQSERQSTIEVVVSSLEKIEGIVNDSLRNFATIVGMTDLDPTITFCKEITDEDVEHFVKMYSTFARRLEKYPGVAKEIDKRALAMIGLPKDELNDALKEIEKAKAPAPEADPVEDALGGDR